MKRLSILSALLFLASLAVGPMVFAADKSAQSSSSQGAVQQQQEQANPSEAMTSQKGKEESAVKGKEGAASRKGKEEAAKEESAAEAGHGKWELGRLERSSEILGKEVYDKKGQKIGKVEEFGIDPRSGRIVTALIGTGGILGAGEKYHAVPFRSLRMDSNGHLALNIDRARFEAGPAYEKDRWAQANPGDVYSYYGEHPYWEGQKASEARRTPETKSE